MFGGHEIGDRFVHQFTEHYLTIVNIFIYVKINFKSVNYYNFQLLFKNREPNKQITMFCGIGDWETMYRRVQLVDIYVCFIHRPNY